MKATQQLHDLGQSLGLDNITRKLLTSMLVVLILAGAFARIELSAEPDLRISA